MFELLDKLSEKQSETNNNNSPTEINEGVNACNPIELIEQIKAIAPGETKGAAIIDTMHRNALNKSSEERDMDALCEKFLNLLSKGAESQNNEVKHDKNKMLVKCA